MTCLYFQKLTKLCKYNYSLPIYDYFSAIFGANFGQKYKQELCIFSLFWHILGKIRLIPKENLVEFVTVDIQGKHVK